MKTRYIVARYLSIIGRLSNGKKATFSQIKNYIENQALDENSGFTIRTFQRIIKDIEYIFQVEIKCDSDRFYYIAEDNSDNQVTRLSQTFHLLNYQKHFEDYSKQISYDHTCTLGQDYIYDIQKAMKEHYCLEIEYQKIDTKDSSIERRVVAPYGLKESNGRWYLVGLDMNKNKIRVFGLDRIKKLMDSDRKYTMPEDFNITEYFKNSVGAYRGEDKVADLVKLKFSKLAGYIKNFPLHTSQVIEEEADDYLIVKLRVNVNTDLINLLMTYSDDVTVIKPEILRKKMLERANAILENNQE